MTGRLYALLAGRAALVAALSVAGGGLAAQGSAAEVSYCHALAQRYIAYVGSSEFSPRNPGDRRTDPEARLATYQCDQGQARSAIPVLERRLRDARVSLPRR